MPAGRAGLVLPARAISSLCREISGGDGNGAVPVVLDSLEFKCGDCRGFISLAVEKVRGSEICCVDVSGHGI